METICDNKDLLKNLEELKAQGYTCIVKAHDKLLSGWGLAEGKAHIQLIAAKTYEGVQELTQRLRSDNTYNYIAWDFIYNTKHIKNWTRNKSYTIRNDFKEGEF